MKKYSLALIALFTIQVIGSAQHTEFIGKSSSDESVVRIETSYDGIGGAVGLEVEAFVNTGEGGVGTGIVIEAGDYGIITTSQSNYGIYSQSAFAPGGFFKGGGLAPYSIELGGSTINDVDTDDGYIVSELSKAGSDIFIEANDAVVIKVDRENSGDEDGNFEIRDGTNDILFDVLEGGDTRVVKGDLTIGSGAINASLDLTGNSSINSNGDLSIKLDANNNEVPAKALKLFDGGNNQFLSVTEEDIMFMEDESEFTFSSKGSQHFLIDNNANGTNNFFFGKEFNVPLMTILECGQVDIFGELFTTGVACSSDSRYKKNIANISDALAKVLDIRGVHYNWDVENWPNKNFNERKQIGFIAQELEQILPELVQTDESGFKSVSYDKLTAVLVEAIKEQQTLIVDLKNKVETLESLSARIYELEKKLNVNGL